MALLLAAATKRRQYPFRSWLPAAMAAPTPVSSLVHSRTLVTAGIFLLLRHGFRGYTILSLVGLVTIVGGGLVAFLGQDAKKIVALSTLSQMGLLTYSLSSCSELLTLNHLLIHAYFKSLLFMCVGVLIHSTFGTQESRMGSEGSSPRISVMLGILSVARIRGLVATSGGGSKHMLLDSTGRSRGFVALLIFVLGSSLTVLYSGKLSRVLAGARSGTAATSCSAVDTRGVLAILASFLLGGMFQSTSPLVIGLVSCHAPSSPFFLWLVLSLYFVGYKVGWKFNSTI